MSRRERDAEKARYWERIIREAARSGMSIREFCRQHRLKESQFYWWKHKLKAGRQTLSIRGPGVNREAASFALVSNEPEGTDAGIWAPRHRLCPSTIPTKVVTLQVTRSVRPGRAKTRCCPSSRMISSLMTGRRYAVYCSKKESKMFSPWAFTPTCVS